MHVECHLQRVDWHGFTVKLYKSGLEYYYEMRKSHMYVALAHWTGLKILDVCMIQQPSIL